MDDEVVTSPFSCVRVDVSSGTTRASLAEADANETTQNPKHDQKEPNTSDCPFIRLHCTLKPRPKREFLACSSSLGQSFFALHAP